MPASLLRKRVRSGLKAQLLCPYRAVSLTLSTRMLVPWNAVILRHSIISLYYNNLSECNNNMTFKSFNLPLWSCFHGHYNNIYSQRKRLFIFIYDQQRIWIYPIIFLWWNNGTVFAFGCPLLIQEMGEWGKWLLVFTFNHIIILADIIDNFFHITLKIENKWQSKRHYTYMKRSAIIRNFHMGVFYWPFMKVEGEEVARFQLNWNIPQYQNSIRL